MQKFSPKLAILLLFSSIFLWNFKTNSKRVYINDINIPNSEVIKCNKKTFNSTSFVCVCNSSYGCDVIELELDYGKAAVFTSSRDDFRFEPSFVEFSEYNSSEYGIDFTIDVNSKNSIKKQNVVGFGSALTDAAAKMINSLSNDLQNSLLESYFSKSGLNYNLVRTNMAGCDFSVREYTYLDTPEDYNLDTFKLAVEDINFKIPILQKIKSDFNENVKYFAAPWTAPNWMKTNNASSGRGRLLGVAGDKYHKTWAKYFIKFLRAYKDFNVDFWAISMQNEPFNGLVNKASWQETAWTPYTQRDFLKTDFYPELCKSEFRNTEIILVDDQRAVLPFWAKVVLSEGNENITTANGIGIHWYTDRFIPARSLDRTFRKFPKKFMLNTEACNKLKGKPASDFLGNWEHGENYSNDILVDLNHHVGGWVDWNMALNLEGKPNWAGNSDDSPIIVNPAKNEFYKNPMYYHLGHFSKFIDENWYIIGGSDSNKDFKYNSAES